MFVFFVVVVSGSWIGNWLQSGWNIEAGQNGFVCIRSNLITIHYGFNILFQILKVEINVNNFLLSPIDWIYF